MTTWKLPHRSSINRLSQPLMGDSAWGCYPSWSECCWLRDAARSQLAAGRRPRQQPSLFFSAPLARCESIASRLLRLLGRACCPCPMLLFCHGRTRPAAAPLVEERGFTTIHARPADQKFLYGRIPG